MDVYKHTIIYLISLLWINGMLHSLSIIKDSLIDVDIHVPRSLHVLANDPKSMWHTKEYKYVKDFRS